MTYTVNDIMGMKIEPLMISDRPLAGLLGSVPANAQFTVSITGPPGSGKTSVSMRFIREFTIHGKTLCAPTEENLASGAIQSRLIQHGIGNHNLEFLPTNSLDELVQQLQAVPYRFCIIDSINEFFDEDGNQIPTDVVVRTTRKIQRTSFLYICQYNRVMGAELGKMSVAHLVDLPLLSRGGEGEPKYLFRKKNRFNGTISEIPIFGK